MPRSPAHYQYEMEEAQSIEVLQDIVYHVFLPPKLPQETPDGDRMAQMNLELVYSVLRAIRHYRKHDQHPQWDRIRRMLSHSADHIAFLLEADGLQRNISEMEVGDVLALYVSAQNAAVLVRKKSAVTTFEVFEVQAPNSEVMTTPGKLVRSYPGPAVEVPNAIAQDPEFLAEISNFLAQMDNEDLKESTPTTTKAGSEVRETRDTAHPHFISQLFLGILRGMGKAVEPRRVVKRIADEVLWHDAYIPWRRSPLWLIIRVALQTTLASAADYKHFMVFFEAQLLLRALELDSFSSDLLFVMRLKMSRRLYKVRASVPEFIMEAVKTASDKTEEILQGRWASIQLAETRALPPKPATSSFPSAVYQTLSSSRAYIKDVFRRRSSPKSPSSYTPKRQARLLTRDFSDFSDDALISMFSVDPYIALLDFEVAVQNHLPTWTTKNLGTQSACAVIGSCLDQYVTFAAACYNIDAADKSIMILIVMELWMSLDRLATSDCPLLLDYSPEIPETVVDSLLLRTALHIKRAGVIQRYLRDRHAAAQTVNKGSVFAAETTQDSFAVRYFRESADHQNLKRKIERDARHKRKQKLDELNEQNNHHENIVNYANMLEHTFQVHQNRHFHYEDECERCQCETDASEMDIEVYEWPLPSNQLQAESVVFELMCPEVFRVWRDATYQILCDVGSSDRGDEVDPHYVLTDQDGLGRWNPELETSDCRVTIASSTKSFLQSHYSTVVIPASENDVCVNCGFSFRFFDTSGRTWASGVFSGTSFTEYGTFSIPKDSPYHHLQYALEGTDHNANQAIADQSECPKYLSLHEHIAFGTLRSGPRLQWMNLARVLEESSLTFSHDEVNLLCTQAAWQLGPLDDDGLSHDWHTELENVSYGRLLIAQSTNVLNRVNTNWREATTVRTIVTLVARLLASSRDPAVHQAAYGFLQTARKVTLGWLDQLLVKLQHVDTSSGIIDYQQRVCEVAAICRSTYDIDPYHLRAVLLAPEDFSALVACFVTIHKNKPAELCEAPVSLQTLICRDRRLAHTTAPIILAQLKRNPRLLDQAMVRLWPDYRAGSVGWNVLSTDDMRWVSTTTAEEGGHLSETVHLDLLEGQLLVDGRPLGQLPRAYTQHSSYVRLFGQKTLDVVPASSPGMEFQTRFELEGHQLYFALDMQSDNLTIQAKKGNTIVELIPYSILAKDFPIAFSSEFHHWANLQTGIIEFRPLSKPWLPNDANWYLHFSGGRASTMKHTLNGNTSCLVDVRSPLFRYIAQRLSPLESIIYLHVTLSLDHRVSVELPRMKLSFFINVHGDLESDNFPRQVVDENQSSGTLIGLRSQLVLRSTSSIEQTSSQARTVLIPHGVVNISAQDNHVSVDVEVGSGPQVAFHQYKVDTNLQLLATNAGLTSRLLKIYLHAVTSHCLPDPLTGRTGTEEALHELSEPAISSFEQINKEQAQLLHHIGSLTPTREYYPDHLRCMQKTYWADLSPLSQHYAYATAAGSILRRASALQLFHPLEFDPISYLKTLDRTLLERSARRSRIYYPAEATSQLPTIMDGQNESDRGYAGGDVGQTEWVQNGHAASWASGLAYRRWKQPTYVVYSPESLFESWAQVTRLPDNLNLSYSSSWLYLNLQLSWFSVYDLCRQASINGTQYQLGVCLASAVYLGRLPKTLLPALIAFATNPSFRRQDPPVYMSYCLSDGYYPDVGHVEALVLSSAYSLSVSPAGAMSRNEDESAYEHRQRKRNYYDQQLLELTDQLARDLMDQWPDVQTRAASNYYSWFDIETCCEKVEQYFTSCSRNSELRAHLQQLENTLMSSVTSSSSVISSRVNLPQEPLITAKSQPTSQIVTTSFSPHRLQHLLVSRVCSDVGDVPLRSYDYVPALKTTSATADTSRLAALLAEFRDRPVLQLHNRYGNDLEKSRMELAAQSSIAFPSQIPSQEILQRNVKRCQDHLQRLYQTIRDSLGPSTPAERLIWMAGVWPCRTPRTILQRLSLSFRQTVSKAWHKVLVRYAEAIVEYQRAQCLVRLARDDKREEFFKELDHDGSNSNISACGPDFLLIQIDGDFRARSVQVKVAAEMISPSSKENTVLQLNMGEGKSSVIVPIVAAALADRSRMVRVMVLKPLWRQMFQLLVSRLAGLAGRRIYYLPFGRHIRIGSAQAQQIQGIYNECMRDGGILLVQPEHILSFQLMAVDRLLSSSNKQDATVAHALQDTQKWLTANSRDILDESDEILHVRYQLVYTVGEQQPLEDHPDRWTTIQQLFPLVSHRISLLKPQFPDSFMCEPGLSGQFPLIRIVPDSNQAAEQLIHTIANDILDGRIRNLNPARLSPGVREAALRFLTMKELPEYEYTSLKDGCESSLWKGLLLLRGLLAHGILLFVLKDKHYRVDYGLDNRRSLLAVPYQAKDTPSLRAEFGHPDVAIALTCLSYYYHGLTDAQLETCFELLYKLDNPSLEYEQWVRRSGDIPQELQQLYGVNFKDRDQLNEVLIPMFSHNAATIDFFLSAIVFPKEAREFPHKLATSGWDLAQAKPHLTTGFSGTNDNQYLLPMSITQADPVKQSSTNALVLNYLLQPENNNYVCTRGDRGETCSVKHFLHLLVGHEPEIRVLLDVGAQMLELRNEELIRYWLALRPDVPAGVFFNDHDELVVLTQNGQPAPLFSSSFSQQLDKCIIYLDDGHTRGTDLSLPQNARAAVTLGPKVTKDRLLQGCMRMRKLGHGQSVMFCAPAEVDNQIRATARLSPEDPIDALDIIRWAMLQTCNDLQRHVSHWAHQGVEYMRRAKAEQKYSTANKVPLLKQGWTTPESRPLEDMYGIYSATSSSAFAKTVAANASIRKRVKDLGVLELGNGENMNEEREREVSHEVELELEQNIERPQKSEPANPKLYQDVRAFIETGVVPANSRRFISLFRPLESLDADSLSVWSPNILATAGFSKTIANFPHNRLSDYMRPVNWIVSGANGVWVAFSPFEVNELLPSIRDSPLVQLHVYAPRVSRSMKSFSDLRFYTIPPLPCSDWSPPAQAIQHQLNLWSGQLYLNNYEEYRSLCAFLGIYTESNDHHGEKVKVQSDGFVKRRGRLVLAKDFPEYSSCGFKNSPIGMLRELIGHRRKGTDYMRTHLGHILHARMLHPNDF